MDIITLSGPLALGSRFRRISDRLFEEIDRVYAELDLPFQSRWFPIVRLLADGRTLGVTELADEIGFSHPGVIQLLRKLEDEGLIESNRDPEDERRRVLSLSPQGHQRVRQLQPVWEVIHRQLGSRVANGHSGFLETLEELEQVLREGTLATELVEAVRSRVTHALEIIDFDPGLARHFRDLNLEWLRRYFTVEKIDEQVLDDPERSIIQPGGVILFARCGERIVGTVALKRQGDGVYELTKMGVTASVQAQGVGRRLLEAALERFRRLRGTQLYLETNSRLKPALKLYRSCGFELQPGLRDGSPYARSDVYMVWRDPREDDAPGRDGRP